MPTLTLTPAIGALLRAVATAHDVERSAYALRHVEIVCDGSTIRMCATDGKALLHATAVLDNPQDAATLLIDAQALIKAIPKNPKNPIAITHADDATTVTVACGDKATTVPVAKAGTGYPAWVGAIPTGEHEDAMLHVGVDARRLGVIVAAFTSLAAGKDETPCLVATHHGKRGITYAPLRETRTPLRALLMPIPLPS